MRLTRLQLAHQPSIRALQGMLRATEPETTGTVPTVQTIDAYPSGVLVQTLEGERWWITAIGWGEIAPGEHPSPQPPPMPVVSATPKGKR